MGHTEAELHWPRLWALLLLLLQTFQSGRLLDSARTVSVTVMRMLIKAEMGKVDKSAALPSGVPEDTVLSICLVTPIITGDFLKRYAFNKQAQMRASGHNSPDD